jgi:uncharacterized membrane protein
MGHSHHPDGAHTHGSSSSNVLDALAQLVAVIALAVAGIDILMWVLHILIIVATAIGFTVLATAGGYGYYKYRQLQNRRLQRLMQIQPPPYLTGRVMPPQMAQAPALPASVGDLHLHLPPGISAAEVEQIVRGRALPGGTERWS